MVTNSDTAKTGHMQTLDMCSYQLCPKKNRNVLTDDRELQHTNLKEIDTAVFDHQEKDLSGWKQINSHKSTDILHTDICDKTDDASSKKFRKEVVCVEYNNLPDHVQNSLSHNCSAGRNAATPSDSACPSDQDSDAGVQITPTSNWGASSPISVSESCTNMNNSNQLKQGSPGCTTSCTSPAYEPPEKGEESWVLKSTPETQLGEGELVFSQMKSIFSPLAHEVSKSSEPFPTPSGGSDDECEQSSTSEVQAPEEEENPHDNSIMLTGDGVVYHKSPAFKARVDNDSHDSGNTQTAADSSGAILRELVPVSCVLVQVQHHSSDTSKDSQGNYCFSTTLLAVHHNGLLVIQQSSVLWSSSGMLLASRSLTLIASNGCFLQICYSELHSLKLQSHSTLVWQHLQLSICMQLDILFDAAYHFLVRPTSCVSQDATLSKVGQLCNWSAKIVGSLLLCTQTDSTCVSSRNVDLVCQGTCLTAHLQQRASSLQTLFLCEGWFPSSLSGCTQMSALVCHKAGNSQDGMFIQVDKPFDLLEQSSKPASIVCTDTSFPTSATVSFLRSKPESKATCFPEKPLVHAQCSSCLELAIDSQEIGMYTTAQTNSCPSHIELLQEASDTYLPCSGSPLSGYTTNLEYPGTQSFKTEVQFSGLSHQHTTHDSSVSSCDIIFIHCENLQKASDTYPYCFDRPPSSHQVRHVTTLSVGAQDMLSQLFHILSSPKSGSLLTFKHTHKLWQMVHFRGKQVSSNELASLLLQFLDAQLKQAVERLYGQCMNALMAVSSTDTYCQISVLCVLQESPFSRATAVALYLTASTATTHLLESDSSVIMPNRYLCDWPDTCLYFTHLVLALSGASSCSAISHPERSQTCQMLPFKLSYWGPGVTTAASDCSGDMPSFTSAPPVADHGMRNVLQGSPSDKCTLPLTGNGRFRNIPTKPPIQPVWSFAIENFKQSRCTVRQDSGMIFQPKTFLETCDTPFAYSGVAHQHTNQDRLLNSHDISFTQIDLPQKGSDRHQHCSDKPPLPLNKVVAFSGGTSPQGKQTGRPVTTLSGSKQGILAMLIHLFSSSKTWSLLTFKHTHDVQQILQFLDTQPSALMAVSSTDTYCPISVLCVLQESPFSRAIAVALYLTASTATTHLHESSVSGEAAPHLPTDVSCNESPAALPSSNSLNSGGKSLDGFSVDNVTGDGESELTQSTANLTEAAESSFVSTPNKELSEHLPTSSSNNTALENTPNHSVEKKDSTDNSPSEACEHLSMPKEHTSSNTWCSQESAAHGQNRTNCMETGSTSRASCMPSIVNTGDLLDVAKSSHESSVSGEAAPHLPTGIGCNESLAALSSSNGLNSVGKSLDGFSVDNVTGDGESELTQSTANLTEAAESSFASSPNQELSQHLPTSSSSNTALENTPNYSVEKKDSTDNSPSEACEHLSMPKEHTSSNTWCSPVSTAHGQNRTNCMETGSTSRVSCMPSIVNAGDLSDIAKSSHESSVSGEAAPHLPTGIACNESPAALPSSNSLNSGGKSLDGFSVDNVTGDGESELTQSTANLTEAAESSFVSTPNKELYQHLPTSSSSNTALENTPNYSVEKKDSTDNSPSEACEHLSMLKEHTSSNTWCSQESAAHGQNRTNCMETGSTSRVSCMPSIVNAGDLSDVAKSSHESSVSGEAAPHLPTDVSCNESPAALPSSNSLNSGGKSLEGFSVDNVTGDGESELTQSTANLTEAAESSFVSSPNKELSEHLPTSSSSNTALENTPNYSVEKKDSTDNIPSEACEHLSMPKEHASSNTWCSPVSTAHGQNRTNCMETGSTSRASCMPSIVNAGDLSDIAKSSHESSVSGEAAPHLPTGIGCNESLAALSSSNGLNSGGKSLDGFSVDNVTGDDESELTQSTANLTEAAESSFASSPNQELSQHLPTSSSSNTALENTPNYSVEKKDSTDNSPSEACEHLSMPKEHASSNTWCSPVSTAHGQNRTNCMETGSTSRVSCMPSIVNAGDLSDIAKSSHESSVSGEAAPHLPTGIGCNESLAALSSSNGLNSVGKSLDGFSVDNVTGDGESELTQSTANLTEAAESSFASSPNQELSQHLPTSSSSNTALENTPNYSVEKKDSTDNSPSEACEHLSMPKEHASSNTWCSPVSTAHGQNRTNCMETGSTSRASCMPSIVNAGDLSDIAKSSHESSVIGEAAPHLPTDVSCNESLAALPSSNSLNSGGKSLDGFLVDNVTGDGESELTQSTANLTEAAESSFASSPNKELYQHLPTSSSNNTALENTPNHSVEKKDSTDNIPSEACEHLSMPKEHASSNTWCSPVSTAHGQNRTNCMETGSTSRVSCMPSIVNTGDLSDIAKSSHESSVSGEAAPHLPTDVSCNESPAALPSSNSLNSGGKSLDGFSVDNATSDGESELTQSTANLTEAAESSFASSPNKELYQHLPTSSSSNTALENTPNYSVEKKDSTDNSPSEACEHLSMLKEHTSSNTWCSQESAAHGQNRTNCMETGSTSRVSCMPSIVNAGDLSDVAKSSHESSVSGEAAPHLPTDVSCNESPAALPSSNSLNSGGKSLEGFSVDNVTGDGESELTQSTANLTEAAESSFVSSPNKELSEHLPTSSSSNTALENTPNYSVEKKDSTDNIPSEACEHLSMPKEHASSNTWCSPVSTAHGQNRTNCMETGSTSRASCMPSIVNAGDLSDIAKSSHESSVSGEAAPHLPTGIGCNESLAALSSSNGLNSGGKSLDGFSVDNVTGDDESELTQSTANLTEAAESSFASSPNQELSQHLPTSSSSNTALENTPNYSVEKKDSTDNSPSEACEHLSMPKEHASSNTWCSPVSTAHGQNRTNCMETGSTSRVSCMPSIVNAGDLSDIAKSSHESSVSGEAAPHLPTGIGCNESPAALPSSNSLNSGGKSLDGFSVDNVTGDGESELTQSTANLTEAAESSFVSTPNKELYQHLPTSSSSNTALENTPNYSVEKKDSTDNSPSEACEHLSMPKEHASSNTWCSPVSTAHGQNRTNCMETGSTSRVSCMPSIVNTGDLSDIAKSSHESSVSGEAAPHLLTDVSCNESPAALPSSNSLNSGGKSLDGFSVDNVTGDGESELTQSTANLTEAAETSHKSPLSKKSLPHLLIFHNVGNLTEAPKSPHDTVSEEFPQLPPTSSCKCMALRMSVSEILSNRGAPGVKDKSQQQFNERQLLAILSHSISARPPVLIHQLWENLTTSNAMRSPGSKLNITSHNMSSTTVFANPQICSAAHTEHVTRTLENVYLGIAEFLQLYDRKLCGQMWQLLFSVILFLSDRECQHVTACSIITRVGNLKAELFEGGNTLTFCEGMSVLCSEKSRLLNFDDPHWLCKHTMCLWSRQTLPEDLLKYVAQSLHILFNSYIPIQPLFLPSSSTVGMRTAHKAGDTAYEWVEEKKEQVCPNTHPEYGGECTDGEEQDSGSKSKSSESNKSSGGQSSSSIGASSSSGAATRGGGTGGGASGGSEGGGDGDDGKDQRSQDKVDLHQECSEAEDEELELECIDRVVLPYKLSPHEEESDSPNSSMELLRPTHQHRLLLPPCTSETSRHHLMCSVCVDSGTTSNDTSVLYPEYKPIQIEVASLLPTDQEETRNNETIRVESDEGRSGPTAFFLPPRPLQPSHLQPLSPSSDPLPMSGQTRAKGNDPGCKIFHSPCGDTPPNTLMLDTRSKKEQVCPNTHPEYSGECTDGGEQDSGSKSKSSESNKSSGGQSGASSSSGAATGGGGTGGGASGGSEGGGDRDDGKDQRSQHKIDLLQESDDNEQDSGTKSKGSNSNKSNRGQSSSSGAAGGGASNKTESHQTRKEQEENKSYKSDSGLGFSKNSSSSNPDHGTQKEQPPTAHGFMLPGPKLLIPAEEEPSSSTSDTSSNYSSPNTQHASLNEGAKNTISQKESYATFTKSVIPPGTAGEATVSDHSQSMSQPSNISVQGIQLNDVVQESHPKDTSSELVFGWPGFHSPVVFVPSAAVVDDESPDLQSTPTQDFKDTAVGECVPKLECSEDGLPPVEQEASYDGSGTGSITGDETLENIGEVGHTEPHPGSSEVCPERPSVQKATPPKCFTAHSEDMPCLGPELIPPDFMLPPVSHHEHANGVLRSG